MDLTSLISKLHPLERKVLPALKKETQVDKIAKTAGMQEIEVMRAVQWLENKGALSIESKTAKVITLDTNAKIYATKGLPEHAFLKALNEKFQPLSKIANAAKLQPGELNACIGLLKRARAIETQKNKELEAKITKEGKTLLKSPSKEHQFLTQKFPVALNSLSKEQTQTLESLKKRKQFVKLEERKSVSITLTQIGKELTKKKIATNVINRLSSSMLKTGKWREQEFRAYDVEINVPQTQIGKKHFVNEAVEYIKRIWLDMGFIEMTGNYVHSAFWDLDALFVPQDHPAREMQDTFYLKGKAQLPKGWEKVKAAHENGGNTGSSGWQYTYSKEEAQKVLLRTHTTVLSAQTLSKLTKKDLPAKFFNVGKVFRNEALDWKHLFEFYQVDGIVVDPNANLKHLKGYLTRFYQKMGYEKVRMRPAHFPYTEPSLEVDVYHPIKKQWVELGGAGIFRPEVVKPLLGFDCPVLAWGQGMGRIIAEYWKITDIRELYKNDLKQLREQKVWVK